MSSLATPYPLPRPASASLLWIVAAASLLLVLVLYAAGSGAILRVALPASATLTALALYLRRPIGYIHFTLWTWFLAPLVRRLVDLRFGFEDQSVVLLAPLLVTAIAGITFIREGRNAKGLHLGPFVLCLAGISYGFFVSLIRTKLNDPGSVTLAADIYGFLTWSTTLLLGLHLYIRWPSYEMQRQAIHKSFLWATLLLGFYGIVQYILAPPWDIAWLEGVGVNGVTFGRPEPYMIRVFSTLNAPGPFALMMQTGLLLLFAIRTRYKFLINAVGYFAFLLSQIRTAWLGWLLGVVVIVSSYRGSPLRRAVLGLLLLPACVLPIMLVPTVAQAVEDRFSTLLHVSQDDSFQDRQDMYQTMLPEILKKPAGQGLLDASEVSVVRSGIDSGIVQIPLKLGCAGAVLFGAGVFLALRTMLTPNKQNIKRGLAEETSVYRAICLCLIAEVISGNSFLGLGGLSYWIFLALWMSSMVPLDSVAKADYDTNASCRSWDEI
jgi:hypothetical protein